jgi:hypothetical protein
MIQFTRTLGCWIIAKAIEKFKSFLPSEETHNALEMKSLIKENQPKLSRILVKIGYNLKVIKTEEICCFYSENKIVYAQTLERSFPYESDFAWWWDYFLFRGVGLFPDEWL